MLVLFLDFYSIPLVFNIHHKPMPKHVLLWDVLVYQGCCKKCHKLGGLNNKLIFHSFGCWEVQDQGTG